MKEKLEWTYKDGGRCWWLIKAWKSDEVPSFPGDPKEDSIDWIWTYEIYRDNDLVCKGTDIKGQYDEPLDPEEIFLEYVNYINRALAGIAKYAKRR